MAIRVPPQVCSTSSGWAAMARMSRFMFAPPVVERMPRGRYDARRWARRRSRPPGHRQCIAAGFRDRYRYRLPHSRSRPGYARPPAQLWRHRTGSIVGVYRGPLEASSPGEVAPARIRLFRPQQAYEQHACHESTDVREPGRAAAFRNVRVADRTDAAEELNREPIKQHDHGGHFEGR